jgi:hypothetical protein
MAEHVIQPVVVINESNAIVEAIHFVLSTFTPRDFLQGLSLEADQTHITILIVVAIALALFHQGTFGNRFESRCYGVIDRFVTDTLLFPLVVISGSSATRAKHRFGRGSGKD